MIIHKIFPPAAYKWDVPITLKSYRRRADSAYFAGFFRKNRKRYPSRIIALGLDQLADPRVVPHFVAVAVTLEALALPFMYKGAIYSSSCYLVWDLERDAFMHKVYKKFQAKNWPNSKLHCPLTPDEGSPEEIDNLGDLLKALRAHLAIA